MPIKNSFPPKLDVILLGGAEAPPAPMVETPMFLHEGTVPSPNHYRISKLTGHVDKAFFPDGGGIHNQNRLM